MHEDRRVNSRRCDMGVAYRERERDEVQDLKFNQRELALLLYRLEIAVGNTHMPKVQEANWSYIPYSHESFRNALAEVKKKEDKSFLEVGCGVGTKLLIARNFCRFERVAGIEILPEYAAVAEELLRPGWQDDGKKIFVTDAMAFAGYGDYDVIYTYQPIRHGGSENLYDRIKEQMKPGARLLMATWAKAENKTGIHVFVKE